MEQSINDPFTLSNLMLLTLYFYLVSASFEIIWRFFSKRVKKSDDNYFSRRVSADLIGIFEHLSHQDGINANVKTSLKEVENFMRQSRDVLKNLDSISSIQQESIQVLEAQVQTNNKTISAILGELDRLDKLTKELSLVAERSLINDETLHKRIASVERNTK